MNISQVVIYSVFVLVGFSLGLFIFIIVRRFYLSFREKRFNSLYLTMETDILNTLTSPLPDFSYINSPDYNLQPKVLTHVLLNLMETIIGSEREELKKIFDHSLKQKYRKQLFSRNITKRLKAARLFAVFANPSETEDLRRLLDDRPVVRLTAIKALSQMPSKETISYIFQVLERDPEPNTNAYFNILHSLGKKTEPFIREYLKKPLSIQILGMLIELVGFAYMISLYDDILVLAKHENKEIRIRVARALGKLSNPDALQTLRILVSDPAWEVQAQAVKSIGELGLSEGLDVLSDSLMSPSWHVRYNAGHALAKLGATGIDKLRQIARQTKDRFSSDMAQMVLQDRNIIQETA